MVRLFLFLQVAAAIRAPNFQWTSRGQASARGSVASEASAGSNMPSVLRVGTNLPPPLFPADSFASLLGAAQASPVGACGATMGWGVDFRSCWGTLRDLRGDAVCGDAPLQALMSGDYDEIELDSAGNSGSTIVKTLPKFIIKSVGASEVEAMRQALPLMAKDMSDRSDAACFKTALAPMCMAIADEMGQAWVLMRKIEIEDGARQKVLNARNASVDWFDLKGPKFGNHRDMKTLLNSIEPTKGMPIYGEPGTWLHKDLGFTEVFPNGIDLTDGHAARGAANALVMDSFALMRNRMTDYSLFMSVWQEPRTSLDTCGRFPIVLKMTNPSRHLAIGVIDYTGRAIRSYPTKAFSTMREPSEYRMWWMKMWPKYFVLPKASFKGAYGVSDPRSRQWGYVRDDGEAFAVGDVVKAVQEIKWFGESRMPSWSSQLTGSTFKVQPGARGRISQFQGKQSNGMLEVEWFDGPNLGWFASPASGKPAWKDRSKLLVQVGMVVRDDPGKGAQRQDRERQQLPPIGSFVKAHGLTSKAGLELNGKVGTVNSHIPDSNRVNVVFENADTKAIKSSNLLVLREAPRE